MQKKRYIAADAAAAFQCTLPFTTPYIFQHSREGERRQAGPVAKEQDKLPPVETLRTDHQSLPQTMSIMPSAYTWRERARRKEGTHLSREDSFGTDHSSLGYHSLITAVVQDAERPGK